MSADIFNLDFSQPFLQTAPDFIRLSPRKIYPCMARAFRHKTQKLPLEKLTDIVTVGISIGKYFGVLL